MVAATFSKRIEGAAYVSRRAGTQVSSTSLMCDDQAEYKVSIDLPYRFHALVVNGAVSFESQCEPLVGMKARLELGLVYFSSVV